MSKFKGNAVIIEQARLYSFQSNQTVCSPQHLDSSVNGERAMEDLRKVVFSSECLFVSSVLLLTIFNPCEYKKTYFFIKHHC